MPRLPKPVELLTASGTFRPDRHAQRKPRRNPNYRSASHRRDWGRPRPLGTVLAPSLLIEQLAGHSGGPGGR